jgi:hypothetical protein
VFTVEEDVEGAHDSLAGGALPPGGGVTLAGLKLHESSPAAAAGETVADNATALLNPLRLVTVMNEVPMSTRIVTLAGLAVIAKSAELAVTRGAGAIIKRHARETSTQPLIFRDPLNTARVGLFACTYIWGTVVPRKLGRSFSAIAENFQ